MAMCRQYCSLVGFPRLGISFPNIACVCVGRFRYAVVVVVVVVGNFCVGGERRDLDIGYSPTTYAIFVISMDTMETGEALYLCEC